MFFSVSICLICLLIIYKVIDFVIRLPRIGNFEGRYILVTGCDTGFGNLLAKRLDQLGCQVFAGCLTEKGETELKKVCSERLHVISMDVTRKDSVRQALDYVKKGLPPGKGLWGIVNNAGAVTVAGAFDWLTVDDYKTQCDVNLWGLIDVTLTFLPLVKMEKGRIVNTSSLLGRFATDPLLPYCVSKYGVEAFTDGLRRSIYYFGCTASVIEPGAFKTPIMNAEQVAITMKRGWNSASTEVRSEYGEKFAMHIVEKQWGGLNQGISGRLSDVVDAYEHALLARCPRARYVVGHHARFVNCPIIAMPEWIGDRIWRYFGAVRMLPASVTHGN